MSDKKPTPKPTPPPKPVKIPLREHPKPGGGQKGVTRPPKRPAPPKK